ncbi:double-strand break repair protein AddB [Yoonia sp. 208BN28-4]|uniref:double-strand break repair protein AddB n=1 Tax=Yoonia sp. 208BN28-4 TaxID=3126505 RepID=UPI0030ACA6F6
MFEPSTKPRLFGVPPGVDFAQAVIDGLTTRSDANPEAFARTRIFVNTSRMQRRMRDLFDAGPPRLLPRVQLITDLAMEPAVLGLAPPVSPLRRRLELSQLVAKLLDSEPDLPRASLYDLSDSLANLMDEMQGEGVSPEKIAALDVSDQSGHWDRALKFVNIINRFYDASEHPPDKDARQRLVIETLGRIWQNTPPTDPVIIAGSTGSRGATALFMQSVAQLPQGAVILPGYDTHTPDHVWQAMSAMKGGEDHPQFRFRKFMNMMDVAPQDIAAWTDTAPHNPARNRLVSLSLRPAPVTDQWLSDGPHLGDLGAATQDVTLLEAASPRAEAEAIALRLRQAVDDGITAALITPDRMLTRQVAAALDRWDIVPDDSAGTPLPLSPPGRFLRHIAEAMTDRMTGEVLLTLLKHPLCNTGSGDRNQHLLWTRELELHLRRHGPPFPTAEMMTTWATDTNDALRAWADWVAGRITALTPQGPDDLKPQTERLMAEAEALSAGPDNDGTGELWEQGAGREARRVCDLLLRDADAGGTLTSTEFAQMFGAILTDGVVRNRDKGHPRILIWGTLEARVGGADLVILGGMNEGVWPEAPAPDPWLNRTMRAKAGLLLPERRIGLSAHDYQQAVTGAEVWISRAKRSSDAETVPSRWVNRLLNLMNGLPEQGGPDAVQAMRTRGERWLAMAAQLSEPDTVTPPARRPSPQPPVTARPRSLSVTRIKTLIRDPYAIYAEKVLRLKPLDPLVPQADAPLRGVIMHRVLELWVAEKPDASDPAARARLLEIANEQFAQNCPWPTIRAQWLTRLECVIDIFIAGEAARQSKGTVAQLEAWGEMLIPSVGVTITCKADRFDVNDAGQVLIYDYKTGTVPTEAMQKSFDKQLLVEAVMVENGAFASLGRADVAGAVFVAVNTAMKDIAAPLDDLTPSQIWAELEQHLLYWDDVQNGYTARRALHLRTDMSPYDHLSRFGEWKSGDDPAPEVMT